MSSNGFIQYNPDLVDEDRGQHILILSVVFSVLIVLSTTLRIILKLWSKMGLGPADYLILISLVSIPKATKPSPERERDRETGKKKISVELTMTLRKLGLQFGWQHAGDSGCSSRLRSPSAIPAS